MGNTHSGEPPMAGADVEREGHSKLVRRKSQLPPPRAADHRLDVEQAAGAEPGDVEEAQCLGTYRDYFARKPNVDEEKAAPSSPCTKLTHFDAPHIDHPTTVAAITLENPWPQSLSIRQDSQAGAASSTDKVDSAPMELASALQYDYKYESTATAFSSSSSANPDSVWQQAIQFGRNRASSASSVPSAKSYIYASHPLLHHDSLTPRVTQSANTRRTEDTVSYDIHDQTTPRDNGVLLPSHTYSHSHVSAGLSEIEEEQRVSGVTVESGIESRPILAFEVASRSMHSMHFRRPTSASASPSQGGGAISKAFLTSEAPNIKDSMAALAAAARLKKMKAKALHDAAANAAARTSSLDVHRRGDRFGGSVAVEVQAPPSRLPKFNSCSTLFVEATLSHADLTQTLRCTPTEDDVFKYFECLFQAADLNVECAVITLIYIERMLVNTGVTLHTSNWARIVLGGLLLAAKVWDDHAVWNIDFCQIFPDVDVSDVNELERWYMAAIQYNVSIKASLYARYYFELRDLAETQIRPWTLKPLTISDANRLEAKTARCQVKVTPETPLNLSKVSIGNSDVSVKDAHGSASGGPESKKLWLDPLSGRSESLAGAVERGMRKSHSDYIFVASAPFASVVMM